jgi:hypothetical protein
MQSLATAPVLRGFTIAHTPTDSESLFTINVDEGYYGRIDDNAAERVPQAVALGRKDHYTSTQAVATNGGSQSTPWSPQQNRTVSTPKPICATSLLASLTHPFDRVGELLLWAVADQLKANLA